MKLNENFVLKTVAGSTVVMPVGEAVSKINGMIKLNDSAKFIWELLEAGKSTERSAEDSDQLVIWPYIGEV